MLIFRRLVVSGRSRRWTEALFEIAVQRKCPEAILGLRHHPVLLLLLAVPLIWLMLWRQLYKRGRKKLAGVVSLYSTPFLFNLY